MGRNHLVPVIVLLYGACQNTPPSTPVVTVPVRCRPGDTVVAQIVSVDRDGDSISYYLAWSEGVPSGWTGWFEPGLTAYVPVVLVESGSYSLTAKARDANSESGWSDTNIVWVRDFCPLVPFRPSGPDTVAVFDTVSYVSSARHPLNEMVSLQFRWSDSLGEWSGFVRPESLVAVRHVFTVTGFCDVRCRARDAGERTSDWSAPETVLVVERTR